MHATAARIGRYISLLPLKSRNVDRQLRRITGVVIPCGSFCRHAAIVTIRHPSIRSARHCEIAPRLATVVPETLGPRRISVVPAHARRGSGARPGRSRRCGHHADRSTGSDGAASRPAVVRGTRPADSAAMISRSAHRPGHDGAAAIADCSPSGAYHNSAATCDRSGFNDIGFRDLGLISITRSGPQLQRGSRRRSGQ